MFVRKPAVSGAFYPSDLKSLNSYLDSVIAVEKNKIKPKAIIVPHAGYVYSGYVAAKAYSMLDSFDTYIIIGPNHTGLGEEIAVFSGAYDMPFGAVETDDDIGNALLKYSDAQYDYYAHLQEHSIEVQLPFIEHISNKPYKIVPIVIGIHDRKKLQALGLAISKAVKESKKDVLIVVSSDMNHYEDQRTTLEKDRVAIDKILKLDEESLFDSVERYDISMCGVAGAYSAIVASKQLGATSALLVEHKTSGDVNKDYTQVVGYASIIIE